MRFAYIFAGGAAYYPALAICVTAILAMRFARGSWWKSSSRVAAVLATAIVAASAIPLDWWLYATWGVAVAAALLILGRMNAQQQWLYNSAMAAAILSTVALGVAELPYRFMPALPYKAGGVLYTLGDSLSMGADTMNGNWPALLGNHAEMEVHAFAFGGAKLGTAMSNAERVEPNAGLVIVELGGNDIFYGTPYVEFADDLDTMLEKLSRHGAPVVLLELPLPPFYNRFGAAQRRLAAKHGAILVPKSLLARVLASPGATIDGLHLSNAGHERLATVLWELREGQ
jgi:acyl-CoA thioesterase-1